MLELAESLIPLVRSGIRVGAISVIRVARSAPRGVGSTMAVTADGAVIGSISGGCVEADSLMLGLTALRSGRAQTASFGFTDDAASSAGLACGGAVDVLAYEVKAEHLDTLQRAEAGVATSVGVVTTGPAKGYVVTEPDRYAPKAAAQRRNVLVPDAWTDINGSADLLVISRSPRPALILLGAGEHSAALCRIASAAGYSVTVCDIWETLVTRARFPEADRLVTATPHEFLQSLTAGDVDERTSICVLTHDERLDVPALDAALRMPVGFVGAMGARATVARRAELLHERGLNADLLSRLHSPLGLDLGGSSPDEVALAILAEVTSARHTASGLPLRELSGPIHRGGEVDDGEQAPRVGMVESACGRVENGVSR